MLLYELATERLIRKCEATRCVGKDVPSTVTAEAEHGLNLDMQAAMEPSASEAQREATLGEVGDAGAAGKRMGSGEAGRVGVEVPDSTTTVDGIPSALDGSEPEDGSRDGRNFPLAYDEVRVRDGDRRGSLLLAPQDSDQLRR